MRESNHLEDLRMIERLKILIKLAKEAECEVDVKFYEDLKKSLEEKVNED